MSKNFYLSPFVVCLAIAVSPGHAAERVPLSNASFPSLQQSFRLALPGSKTTVAAASSAKPTNATNADNKLQFVQQHTDANKVTHVRLQQQYAGFPVFGGYAIMHTAKTAQSLLSAKNDVKMNGAIYRGLETELGQPPLAFVEHATAALQQFKAQYQHLAVSEDKVTPMVYIDDNQRAFWAYKVSVLVTYTDKIPERPTAIIDAQTLKPFKQWNDVKTIRSEVTGMGFGGNHRTGIYQYGKDLPLLQLSRDEVTNLCFLENDDVKVVDMRHQYTGPNRPMQFGCKASQLQSAGTYWTGYQGDGYDLNNGAYSPSNDALYTGQVIKSLYMDWYGLDVLTEGEKPMQLVLRVHFGEGYENAYWGGQQMTFGDGEEMMYPLVSLGVGAHEISHGFTEQHSNLEYFGQSGGMNEAFSDMAAQAAEYYSVGKSSWTIGAEILKEESGYTALRFMDIPSRDGRSIDNAEQYNDEMDVHYSSGVYNRFFYLLANQPQWDVKQAFQVMVKANMDYWTPNSTFAEGGCGVISAANDLGLPTTSVKQVLDQVAISYKNCDV